MGKWVVKQGFDGWLCKSGGIASWSAWSGKKAGRYVFTSRTEANSWAVVFHGKVYRLKPKSLTTDEAHERLVKLGQRPPGDSVSTSIEGAAYRLGRKHERHAIVDHLNAMRLGGSAAVVLAMGKGTLQ